MHRFKTKGYPDAHAICHWPTVSIQSLVEAGHLALTWIAGRYCVADLLAKILNRDTTEFHRRQIGNVETTAAEQWQFTTGKETPKKSKSETKVSKDRRTIEETSEN